MVATPAVIVEVPAVLGLPVLQVLVLPIGLPSTRKVKATGADNGQTRNKCGALYN